MTKGTDLPSVAQMVNRANTGHRRALRACRDDHLAVSVNPAPSEIRGMRIVFSTLRRWDCINGDELTDRGRALLERLEARAVEGRYVVKKENDQ